jgi:hypothetical protein
MASTWRVLILFNGRLALSSLHFASAMDSDFDDLNEWGIDDDGSNADASGNAIPVNLLPAIPTPTPTTRVSHASSRRRRRAPLDSPLLFVHETLPSPIFTAFLSAEVAALEARFTALLGEPIKQHELIHLREEGLFPTLPRLSRSQRRNRGLTMAVLAHHIHEVMPVLTEPRSMRIILEKIRDIQQQPRQRRRIVAHIARVERLGLLSLLRVGSAQTLPLSPMETPVSNSRSECGYI